MTAVPAVDWRRHAACRGCDPALFIPMRGDNTAVTKAKAICAGCPSRLPCLEYALNEPEKQGVWGGTSERERRNLRRTRHLQLVAEPA